MPRFVIEREIPDVGTFEREQLREAAQGSNGVLAAMKAENKNIQWEPLFSHDWRGKRSSLAAQGYRDRS